MAICPAGHTSAAEDYCDICGLPVSTDGSAAAPQAAQPDAPAGSRCPICGTNNVPDALFCEACGYDFTTGTPPRSTTPEPAPEPVAAPDQQAQPADATEHEADASEPSAPVPTSFDGAAPTPAEWGSPAPDDADGQPPGDQPAAEEPGTPPPAGQEPGQPNGNGQAATADAVAEAGVPAAPVPTLPSSRPNRPRPAAVDFVAEIWIDPAWYASQGSTEALPSPGLPEVIPLRATSALIGRTSISRSIHPDIDCDPDSGVSRRHAQVTTDGTRWWIEDLESANGTFIGPSAGALPTTPIGRGRVEFAPDQRIYLGGWTRIVIRPATDDEQQAFAG